MTKWMDAGQELSEPLPRMKRPRSTYEQEDSTSWPSSRGRKTQQKLLGVKPKDGRCSAWEALTSETIGLVMLTAATYRTTTERETGPLPLLQQDFLEQQVRADQQAF